jgi:hypothetical protein
VAAREEVEVDGTAMMEVERDTDAAREIELVEQMRLAQAGQGAMLCRRERRDVAHRSLRASSTSRHSARVFGDNEDTPPSRKKSWMRPRPYLRTHQATSDMRPCSRTRPMTELASREACTDARSTSGKRRGRKRGSFEVRRREGSARMRG